MLMNATPPTAITAVRMHVVSTLLGVTIVVAMQGTKDPDLTAMVRDLILLL